MIKLFERDQTNFENNGIAAITNYIFEPVIEETLNGLFSFSFKIPIFTKYGKEIKAERIITAPIPDGTNQPFRINKVKPSMGILYVEAYHIFYDLADNFIEDIGMSGTGQSAGSKLLASTQFPNEFEFVSDISKVSNARVVRYNPVQALLDDSKDNTFISRWGGEIERNGYRIIFNSVRGTDRGVRIKNKKNLVGYEATIDYSNIWTRILPMGYDGLKLPELYVDSPNIGNYVQPKIKVIDYQDIKVNDNPENGDLITLEQAYELLRESASTEFSENHVDEPTGNYKVNFVDLSQTKEYRNFKALEKVLLGDTIYVDHTEDNFHVVSRIIKYKWNPISKRYIEIEMGTEINSASNQYSSNSSLRDDVNSAIDNSNKALSNSDEAVTSANGKNKNWYNAPDNPPTKMIVGDLWFKSIGDETELWQYVEIDGIKQWQMISSTKDVTDAKKAGEEASQKADDAQTDASNALNNANSAVDKANDAAAKADNSEAIANQAKNDATNALGAANQAQADAEKAISDASKAIFDSSKALDGLENLDTVNLLPNSTWNSGQGTWTVGFNGRYEILQPEEDKPNSNILHGLPLTTGTQQLSNMPHPIYVSAGQNYALAFDFKELNYSSSKSILFLRIFEGKTTPNTSADALWSQSLKHATFGINSNVNEFRRLTYAFSAPFTGWLDVVPYDGDESGIHESFYREIMLVKSNVIPKSWSPYPGDTKIQIDNINGELSQKVSQATFDVLNQTVVNQATQINQNATDIALKANQSTVDNLAGRVTDAEASIDLNAKEIKLKASQKTVDTIAGRVDTAEASLVTMAGEIELKASQTSVDTLNDTVESVQSELKVEAGKISALNTLTDGHTTQIGSLQTGYDGLSSTVALVQNRFTDGNNLITDGDFESGLNRGIELYQTLESYPKPSGNYAARLYVNGTEGSEYTQQWTLPTPITLLANTEYTIEYDYSVAGTAHGTASDYARDENGNWISGIMMEKSQHVLTGGQTVWKKYVNTFKLNQETVLSRLRFGFVLNGDGVGWKTIDNIKIYQGSSIVTQFSNLTQEVDTIQATVVNNEANTQAQLIILSDQITSTVGQLRDGNNLIDDGNFESGNGRGLSLIGQTDTYPKPSGNYMARLMKIGGTASEDYYQLWTLPTPITLLANTEYTIAYDYSVAGTARGNASDYLRTATGSWVSGVMMDHESHSLVGGQGVWKKYTKTFSLSAETTISAMRFGFVLNGNGTGWKVIDNIKIYQGISTQSQITQLTDAINLRVEKGDVINQINVNDQGVLIAGQKVHITGQTTIDSAVIGTAHIKDAAITNAKIGSLSADKINAGTLDAANVNVINLNASNIVTGSISGQNLSINLATGEVNFQKGTIRSESGSFRIDIDNDEYYSEGSFGDLVMNGARTIAAIHGGLFRSGYILKNDTNPKFLNTMSYESIGRFVGKTSNQEINVMDLETNPDGTANLLPITELLISGNSGDANGVRTGSFFININQYDSTGKWINAIDMPSFKLNGSTGEAALVAGKGDLQLESYNGVIKLNGGGDGYSKGAMSLGKDTTGGRIWAMAIYERTYSSGPNVTITNAGTLGRITSARKYKMNIITANNVINNAKRVLSIQPVSWNDKSEMIHKGISKSYYGFIADEFHEKGLTEVVIYDNHGEVEGLSYDRITMYHNVILSEHEQRIALLELEIKNLKKEIEELEVA